MIARPKAIAPLIIPAYDRNTHSLNLRDFYAPKQTNKYCTESTEKILATTMSKSSMQMKLIDQSCYG